MGWFWERSSRPWQRVWRAATDTRDGSRTVMGQRRVRILDLLVGGGAPEFGPRRLCATCAEVTGMTGDVSVGRALVRLRAHAFGHDRTLNEVARNVVERRLRFDIADEI